MSTGGGGGGGSSTQTVTQEQQIPAYEQQFSQNNQALAQSLASQPYPVYGGSLVAPMNGMQNSAINNVPGAASSYEPYLTAAGATAASIPGLNPTVASQGDIADLLSRGANLGSSAAALNPENPGVIQSLMSPYVSAALAPQIQQLQTQLGQEQQSAASGATEANAYGDARQGTQNALNNFYGNLSLNDLLGQGYNTAYGNAESTALGEQSNLGSLANLFNSMGTAQQGVNLNEQSQLGNLASMLSGMGQTAQSEGLQGANAVYDAGALQQQLQQQQLNTAYQQYQNQVNWPYQMLNVSESALSNSPYNIANYTTLPQANMTAQNLGAFSSLAGMLGSLGTGGAAAANVAPFGGAALAAG